VAVTQWTVTVTPADALADWRSKPGLGGREIPPSLQARVLDEVEAWARRAFDDLEDEERAPYTYVVQGVHFGRGDDGREI
jgi:hypothetical protein